MRVLGAKGRALCFAASLVVVASACKTELSSAPQSRRAAPAARPTVEAPKNLAASFVVRDPELVLKNVRGVLGARGGVLASRDRVDTWLVELGLPASTLALYGSPDPVVGAVTEADAAHETPSFAVAIKLTDTAQLLTLTTFGAAPAFESRRDVASGGDVLVPARGQTLPFALGVFGTHLVVGTDEAVVTALGPFLDQTLAPGSLTAAKSRSGVSIEVEGAALAPVLGAWLSERASDLPIESKAFLDPTTLLVVVREAGKITVETTIEADRVNLAMSAVASPATEHLGLGRGSSHDVLGAPSGSQAAITVFEGLVARRASADSAAASLGALLDKEDAEAMGHVLGLFATARGDRSTFGFEMGPRGPALFGDLAVSDRGGAERALGDLVDAMGSKSVEASLARIGFSLGAKKTVVENVGDVARLRVTRLATALKRGASVDRPPAIDLFLRLEEPSLLMGAGYDAQSALSRARGSGKLAVEPRVHAALSRVPEMVSLAVFFDLSALSRPKARVPSSALVTVDVDPDERKLRATLELDAAALAALLDLVSTHNDPHEIP